MITKIDPSIIQSYLEDSSNLSDGYAEGVVLPETYDEVSLFLKEANDKKLPVTISGGGTGTCGGRIPFGGTVLSTEKFNKIRKIEKKKSKGFITSEAGVLIKDLKECAEQNNLFYTYDPTEQLAFVGGTIATNASGARSFKYGSTRESVSALTLCLADGSIFKLKRGNVKARNNKISFSVNKKEYIIDLPIYKMPRTKNSAGYYVKKDMDLIDLFIGQEGTLACVLDATFSLPGKPEDILSCYAFFADEESAFNFAREARILSQSTKNDDSYEINALSIEYFDSHSLDLLNQKYGNVPSGSEACIFFEQEVSRDNEDKIIENWESLLSKYSVSLNNTWVAMTPKERQALLDRRHYIPQTMNEMAKTNKFPKVSTDLAVSHKNFMEMAKHYKKTLSSLNIRYFLFGHIGDSHMHMNIFPQTEDEYLKCKRASLELIKKSVSLGGTVSAEHGIGKTRKEYLKILYGEKGIKEMFSIKKILDPNLILGRGNIFSDKL